MRRFYSADPMVKDAAIASARAHFTLHVHLQQAMQLANADLMGTSDPYCLVCMARNDRCWAFFTSVIVWFVDALRCLQPDVCIV